ncbi:hypothetical protein NQ317_003122 [Molorchus minor]|uniref:Uncharacterized protein n=1 Tax=Molorchus minor TaxID=1323400 RepID=A0ABQ9JM22_9CUCU|nr:hypothetical protein NQ317_003122 [Molorchus minor]
MIYLQLPSATQKKEKNSNGQTLKRINQDLSKENPPKKIKIDKETTSKQNLKVKQEKDNFISKDSAPQKRPVDNDENTARRNENRNIDIEVNPFAFLNKNKKYKVEMNSGDKNDNPFKSQKTQRSTARKEDDSPDLSICKKKKEDSKERIFTSTKINKLDLSVNFSKISKINTSNSIWYSKNTTVEIKQDENLDNTFDSEMQKFIDQFKDTVIVEAIIKLPKREIYQNRLNNEMSPKGKLNFKKFLKIMPLRPQKIVIGNDIFIDEMPRDAPGIVDSRRERHFKNDEIDNTLSIKRREPKKFLI